VIVWLPTASVAVLNEAVVTPAVVVTVTGLPVLLPSIWNWTVPVGVPLGTLIVAVNVTLWPNAAALAEERTVVVLAVVPLVLTTCPPDKVPLLVAKLASPL